MLIIAANTLTKKIMYNCPRGNGLVAKMMNEQMDETDIARIVADLILAAGDTVNSMNTSNITSKLNNALT